MQFKQFLEVDTLGGMGMGGMGIPAGMAGGGMPPMPGGMPGMPPMGGPGGMKPPMGGMGGGGMPPPPPMGNMKPGGMGGQQAPQMQPIEIQTKDVWSVLEKLLQSGKKTDVKKSSALS